MQQQSRLQIKGMSHQLPPAMSEDGECSRIINLRCKNNVWEPVGEPRLVYASENPSRKIAYLHCNEAYKHYISYDGTNLYFEAEEKDDKVLPTGLAALCPISGLLKIESVGNTLVVIEDAGIFYLLYINGKYEVLGTRPEMPELSFYLGGSIEYREFFGDYYPNPAIKDDGVCRLSDTDKNLFTSSIYGTYSKCRNRMLTDGYFAHPFLARYALRMYDGSYILPSPPMAIFQSDKASSLNDIHTDCEVNEGTIKRFISNQFNLRAEKFFYHIKKCDLSKWSDIIAGIDLFFSKEVPVVKQAPIMDKDYRYDTDATIPRRTLVFNMPQLTDKEVRQRLIDETVFYKVASLTAEDGNMTLDTPAELQYNCDLTNIEQLDALPLDNFSHHDITAKTSYVYNGRLHLGGISMRYFKGFSLPVFALTQSRYNGTDMDEYTVQRGYIKVYLKGAGSERHLVNSFTTPFKLRGISSYISYPDSRAYKMEIRLFDDVHKKQYQKDIEMKASPDQNVSYFMTPDMKPLLLEERNMDTGTEFPEEKNPEERTPNKLRVSEINNPFVFPQELTYTLSNGEIIDLAAATAALSQGQYGEFPLYVFTSEGIWALQQGSEGVLYSNQHPVNREVCLSSDLIIPIDNAVVYLSEQGLMVLQGADSQLLSPVFEGNPDNLPEEVPMGSSENMALDRERLLPFRDYIRGKGCAGFNYIRQEIIFLNPSYGYNFIFNLVSSSWYCHIVNLKYLYNLYPGLLAGDDEGKLYDLCSEIPVDMPVSAVTRAIKLLPDTYKRISQLALRCDIPNAKDLTLRIWGAQEAEGRYSLLYGTQISGRVSGQIRMRPVSPAFKYHRIELSGTVSPEAHIDVIDLGFDPALTNRKLY